MAGRLTPWGRASSLTVASPPASCSSIARRIGWDRAEKIASRFKATVPRLTIWLSDGRGPYLTFLLSIRQFRPPAAERTPRRHGSRPRRGARAPTYSPGGHHGPARGRGSQPIRFH